jgi:hypothetical protein
MARRASSATNPIWFLAAALLVAAAIGIGWWLKSRVGDPFRTLPVFPLSEYMQNADSLRGNTYKIEGIIGKQLKYTAEARLFEVFVGGGDPVSIVVPSEFNHLDLRPEGRFQFKIEVAEKGILRAKDLRKE